MIPTGLFAQHPLHAILHAAPTQEVTHSCPGTYCKRVFVGPARQVLEQYREHVLDAHFDELEDCGCCGGYHFPTFRGDCREDWERF